MSVDDGCDNDDDADAALGAAAAAGAVLREESPAASAVRCGPEALAALQAELASSRQLLSNANRLADEYREAAEKIAAAAEEKEAKRQAAFEEEVAAAKVGSGILP